MKGHKNTRFIILLLLAVFFSSTLTQNIYAQETKKNKIRLKAEYVKVMDDMSYLNISASAKINKQNTSVSDIDIFVFSETDEEEMELGTLTTDMQGKGVLFIKNLNNVKADSTNTYNFNIVFKGNDDFKKASKSISVKDATLKVNIVKKDSINNIIATLFDAAKDSLLANQILDVQVQRIFKPLKIGKEFNTTDKNGTVIVPIEKGIPGVDGNITIEVVLKDHDDYGTVKALAKATTETVIVDESMFDDRTLWSPRNKTPLFILFFTNMLIFSIWGIIIYLIIKLFKINKS